MSVLLAACKRTSVVSLCLFPLALTYAQEPHKPLITLDGNEISGTPHSQYVEALLTQAYDKVGYRVRFEPMPLARSFLEANDGVLDGLRARMQGVEKTYPNLVPVPYPLFEFRTLLIADRRRCGICDLSQLSHLVTLRGALSQQAYFSGMSSTPEIREVTHPNTALDMLAAQRTQAAVLPEPLIPPAFYRQSAHWITYPLDTALDFHYLHKRHQAFAQKLGKVLQEMDDKGEIGQLRQEFGIVPPFEQLRRQSIGSVNAVSSEWEDYTDTADGTYWQILKASLKDKGIKVKHAVTNWKRAKADFMAGKYDMLVGAYEFEIPGEKLLSNLHIDYEQPVIAIGADKANLHALLAGQINGNACHVLGYEFAQWLPKNINIYESSNLRDCFNLLSKGRLDMVVDYDFNLSDAAKTKYQTVEVRESLPVFVVFHSDQRGRLLHHYFEQGFRTLIMNGEAAALFPGPNSYETALLEVLSKEE
ncbi:hypothetical protein P2G88_09700 [Aliiglaciecola sp. CAU 1673]|uniref:hypothetical protein n=1 Tax=Aliiglaciecola sp. CAU 1673 TaxID=3032595 RepID=UPI0023DB4365|nr:hypothetical protein [Aliiglaciecola sp. CAU 1673]MDF2178527.1 hypothetical protein [Aliiglaciecola sp. CAU 1673]